MRLAVGIRLTDLPKSLRTKKAKREFITACIKDEERPAYHLCDECGRNQAQGWACAQCWRELLAKLERGR